MSHSTIEDLNRAKDAVIDLYLALKIRSKEEVINYISVLT